MHSTSMYPLSLPLLSLLIHLAFSQSVVITPTTVHFFPRTSCNRGTSLSYTTVADLYDDNTCHITPVGTEALYIDSIADGCAIMAFSDSACSQSALLSQLPIAAGTCQFYGDGNSIGAWQGHCGAGADANSSTSTSTSAASDFSASSAVAFSTMSAPANTSIGVAAGTTGSTQGNGTFKTGGVLATQTPTSPPGLQSLGVASSGVAGLREEDWARRMMFKALLAMGSAEVMWAFVPV